MSDYWKGAVSAWLFILWGVLGTCAIWGAVIAGLCMILG